MWKYGITCKTQKLSFKKNAALSISCIKNRESPAYTLGNGTDQKYIMLVCNGSKENNFKNQPRKYNLLVSV